MNEDFWQQRWKENNIAFHQSEANPLLVKYFESLALTKGDRIFLPLCGKTLDIAWLLSKGFRVVGVEFADLAIRQLFSELKVTPKISQVDKLVRYSAEGLDIYVGDFFHLTKELLGQVDAVYDRAALVALPPETRILYTKHLVEITDHAPQLLIAYDYDQNVMSGPPFSVPQVEIESHYKSEFHLTRLASLEVQGGLRGQCPAKENVWELKSI
ncbi:thiopurine S-methyltransferase [Leptospira wolffii]|uniref:Thiopurine S-methyltransferase n=1 Tax=Leptospira wolffii TaxID=409998 RepID=A0ABV5BPB2_9LEPT|nr:thiopurine S-methyltransferase [Leptospira wolffii]TGL47363.1 thiopurine S-methyltransferase [Leptospira wolffii]